MFSSGVNFVCLVLDKYSLGGGLLCEQCATVYFVKNSRKKENNWSGRFQTLIR